MRLLINKFCWQINLTVNSELTYLFKVLVLVLYKIALCSSPKLTGFIDRQYVLPHYSIIVKMISTIQSGLVGTLVSFNVISPDTAVLPILFSQLHRCKDVLHFISPMHTLWLTLSACIFIFLVHLYFVYFSQLFVVRSSLQNWVQYF